MALGTLTVAQLNEYIKTLIDCDKVLSRVSVIGEISNFKAQSSGHLYFTLKDENSAVSAVMFRFAASKLKFKLENGLKVVVTGRISVYTQTGQYQIYAESVVPDGIGALALKFEQLKSKLEKEGLFSAEHKKQIPRFPKTVGVITSPSGAAVRDIINVATRRYPLAKIIIYPAVVQGDEAEGTLINGISFFSHSKCADVVIIGRGGGSIEDLWSFNSEALARQIYSCEVPVISAVGHESDFTICDFVADKRAPTPSAAAELALPDSEELLKRLSNAKDKMAAYIQRDLKTQKEKFERLSGSYVFKNPDRLFEMPKMTLDRYSEALDSKIQSVIESSKNSFAMYASSLYALSPLAVLKRGYSALYIENSPVCSVNQLSKGQAVDIKMADGSVSAVVQNVTTDRKD